MKACVLESARNLFVRDLPDPFPQDGEVLIRLGAGGICGSDLHYYAEGGVGDFRLRQPLVKRDGKLQPASWDEAFEEVERRLLPILREHGPDAVAASLGNPVAHKISLLAYLPRLMRALGTRNVFSLAILLIFLLLRPQGLLGPSKT